MQVLKKSYPSPDNLYAGATTKAAGRLLAICPDVSQFLPVVALRKGILRSVRLYLDGDVAEVGHFK
jgi:hypothetical protein